MLDVRLELRKMSKDYVLMFVGDGELKESIKLQAKQLKLSDSVMFLGVRKDVSRLLQAMDFFIFPSFNEGLGMGLIEAQAAGLPCLANKDGIMPLAKITDLVEMKPLKDGAKSWAEYIDSVRKSNLKRKDMSEAVKNAGFDIAEVAKSLESFYLKIQK